MKETILIMFSGGADSTYMLYHYLKNTNYNIHAHHISMRYPSEPRWKEEDIASRKIIKYCQQIRNFHYTESRFDFGFHQYVGRDSDTQLLIAAKVAPNLRGKVSVALGWQYRTNRTGVFADRLDNDVSGNLWNALCDSIDPPHDKNISRQLLFPLIELQITKAKIFQTLPKELLDLTWSCRHPKKMSNGSSKPCGKCRVCLQVKEARGA